MTTANNILEKDINDFLASWTEGILGIGRAFRNNKNYKEIAMVFILK